MYFLLRSSNSSSLKNEFSILYKHLLSVSLKKLPQTLIPFSVHSFFFALDKNEFPASANFKTLILLNITGLICLLFQHFQGSERRCFKLLISVHKLYRLGPLLLIFVIRKRLFAHTLSISPKQYVGSYTELSDSPKPIEKQTNKNPVFFPAIIFSCSLYI